MKAKAWILSALTAAALLASGCSDNKKSIAVEEQCGSCVGGSCEIPADLAANTGSSKSGLRKIPLLGGQSRNDGKTSAALDTKKSAATVKPAALAPRPSVASAPERKIPDSYRTLSGGEGHYNEVKLAGMGHEQPEEQTFLVRKFNRNIWPGGVPLEAEIDPAVMNF